MIRAVTILEGDTLDRLRELPEKSVQCCISSPPYWALRDYKIPLTKWPAIAFRPVAGLDPITISAMECCLGLEEDPWAFVAHIVQIYRETSRVLKDDGVIWVNMGDSYASNGGHSDVNCNDRRGALNIANGLKPKDLAGMPWRVAQALQADGWYLRCDVIWHKENPMPESTRDRPTKAHEYVFLLSKSQTYYYDNEAIREVCSGNTHARRSKAAMEFPGNADRDENRRRPAYKVPDGWDITSGNGGHGAIHKEGRSKGPASYNGSDFRKGKKAAVHQNVGQGERKEHRKLAPHGPNNRIKNNDSYEEAMCGLVETRNKRSVWRGVENEFLQFLRWKADQPPEKTSVWSIPTAPFKEAHFATFPPDLILPCILAGSRAGDTILDQFLGSGTTAMVAVWHGRKAVGIELNPDYAAMARRRCLPSALDRARLVYESAQLEPLPLFAMETK